MKKAKLILEKDYIISAIDNRIYGSFVEHLGRCVYTGIYEPTHPSADEEGFRKDVLELVKGLNVPVVRYPGGNFASALRWEDSVGPRDKRPRRPDPAWKSTEPNEVGLHEFASWTKKAGAQMMYAINLGTRGPAEARDLVEYANHQSGTYYSDLRIQNGAKDPLNIKLWCLGNEMDGDWQMGQKTAYEYGRIANEAAKQMKSIDDSIELVVCGSTNPEMPTYGAWEYEVLNQTYNNVDYVSVHRYYNNYTGDSNDFLAKSLDLDRNIRTIAAFCDAVQGMKHSSKKLYLSLDEWNVWYHSHTQDRVERERNPWGTGLRLIEDVYNFEDALLVGLLLITILKHADRIKIACMAQLVNVIAPIMTRPGGGAWAQTIYWPMKQASEFGRGKSLLPLVTCEKMDTANFTDVPLVDAAAVLCDDDSVTIFAVNRDLKEAAELTVELRSFGSFREVSHSVLHHDDLMAENSELNPDNVKPYFVPADLKEDKITLPAASWNVIRLMK